MTHHHTHHDAIAMVPVSSSNIESIGYDEGRHALRVKFKDSGLYEYSGVTPEQHSALVNAPSVGRHFHVNIKGRHSSTRL